MVDSVAEISLLLGQVNKALQQAGVKCIAKHKDIELVPYEDMLEDKAPSGTFRTDIPESFEEYLKRFRSSKTVVFVTDGQVSVEFDFGDRVDNMPFFGRNQHTLIFEGKLSDISIPDGIPVFEGAFIRS